ncbi:MAG: serine dehydratase subunit alpha family protein, partial [Deltaproteobacteria bacterium]
MAYTVKDILRAEVKPALGCTEPVAVALGAAAAASLLPGGRIDSIEVWVDPNTFKNGLVVSIPGTKGLSGLDLAAALGAIGGDPRLGLEVLRPVDEGVVRRARELLARGAVKIHLFAEPGLHIRTVLVGGGRRAESVIRGFHDRIVRLALDGRELRDNPLLSDSRKEDAVDSLEGWLRGLSLEELLRLLGDLDEEDLEFLELGIVYNLRLAKYGLEHGPGLGVGKALERLAREGILKKDMVLQAKIITSAAADARMAGVKLPAMASAGSGNHGLT